MAYSIGSSFVNTSRKPLDDEVLGLVLGQAPAFGQVEDLVGADLAHGRLVGHRRVVFGDVDVWYVAAALIIEHERVAADVDVTPVAPGATLS